jgi:hypothetical protein
MMSDQHIIKISNNCFREFHAMIDSCADNSEDDHWLRLWTQLSNSTRTSKGYRSPRLVELNNEQIIKLNKWITSQIDYLLNVTIGQCNDDREYKEANAVRYTVKGLKALNEKLSDLVN